MNNSTSNARSRSKLLIPGLLLVLLLVLVWPSRKSESARPALERSRIATSTPGTKIHFTSVPVLETGNHPTPPTYTLMDAIAVNPFDLPNNTVAPASPAPPHESVFEPLDEIVKDQPPVQPAPVQLQAIFFDHRGAAAIIEDHIFRNGDQLSDGRKILRITKHGVELTP